MLAEIIWIHVQLLMLVYYQKYASLILSVLVPERDIGMLIRGAKKLHVSQHIEICAKPAKNWEGSAH